MIVNAQMCASIDGPMQLQVGPYFLTGMFSERHWPTCSCPAYKFSKATINFGGRMVKPECKHIERAQDEVCGWHEQWDGHPRQTEEQRKKFICPRCGGSTVAIQVFA